MPTHKGVQRLFAVVVALSLALTGHPAVADPGDGEERGEGTPSGRSPAQNDTPVQVVARARLANNSEAATFVSTGRLKNSVVIVDGNELLRIKVGPAEDGLEEDDRLAKKILDLSSLPITVGVRGIAYLPDERIFLVQEPNQRRTLYAFDEHGRVLPSRPITYPTGFVPAHIDGLAYIPPEASRFGDRIVSVVYDNTFVPRIHVMTRDGVVEDEIVPEALEHEFVTGIGYRAPDRLMLGTDGNSLIWTVDLEGNLIGEPVETGAGDDFEGLVQAADGMIYGTPYHGGHLRAFDPDLARVPALDRTYTVGIGAPFPCCMAWVPDFDAFAVYRPLPQETVDRIPTSLDSATQLIAGAKFGSAQGITYLPEEDLIGLTRRGQRRVLLFDHAGTPAGRVDFSTVPCSAAATAADCADRGRVIFASYLPGTSEFTFGMRSRPDPNAAGQIHFADRAGTYLRTIDLAATLGIAVTHIAVPYRGPDASGPERLVISDDLGKKLVITDAAATTIGASIDYRGQLGLVFVNGIAQITSGPLAGAIAVADTENSEMVIFRIR